MMDKSNAHLAEQVTERMKQRESERLLQIESKKELNDSATNSEMVSGFARVFHETKQNIEEDISKAHNIDKNLLLTALVAIKSDIQNLQKYLSTSTLFLCRYDIRKAQEAIQELMHKVQEIEETQVPKKKFAFKMRKSKELSNGVSKLKIEDSVDSSSKAIESKAYVNTCGYYDKVNETLVLSSNEIFRQDVTLSNLDHCTVKLYGTPSTVHITCLRNCTVLSGPVATSVLIESCFNCTFVLPCQQLRIHNTKNSDFYIHVTTKAIIEDCTGVQFAPYNWHYDGIQEHYKQSGLDLNRNHWDEIDDFNWLSSDKPSPNWVVLKERERNIVWD
ncbi:tubulin-specific chaperone C-like isoform X1 [Ischnura elegans]|uniref:tubulin-specific chaperone C-like isoform X1 n=1 Tax=Ischnura elegans TaxID=197161 RepID=UPI001ED89997|nr:tubulin-specific chaperone C-like isoform X1 [Ischnura elegans]XP_046387570.1 tubulin-specific chaperone C-like isoform X1 [Ischnura elegans]XP_046387571.1 tubulin-specific chaperone C-like isoform X1 [Ischnura elegans]